ncbi:diguanylate cyclase domain-containing protein [Achromobacter aloeverae]|uniref:diguanylate cyclase domain-containing protein n=1 Tax=Achromobacter aloeverae TaxID=1750518 RepID=UPI0023D9416E|nr:diguanylate cyclase [Achromobacter aloeverae]
MRAAAFDLAPQAIVLTDARGVVMDVNAAFERATDCKGEDLRGQRLWRLQPGIHRRTPYRAVLEAVADAGTWQGEFWVRWRDGGFRPEWVAVNARRDGYGTTVGYIATFMDSGDMAPAQREMAHMALHDPLTGLPNRRLLMSRLQAALGGYREPPRCGAALFIDLDGFKQVNDAYGHRAGDELLKAVAARMSGRLRRVDTLARLGGDEFVIVLDGPDGELAAETVAREILELLQAPFDLETWQGIRVGASIGITLFPQDGATPEQILDCADKALYAAKAAGKGHFRFSGHSGRGAMAPTAEC